MTRIAVIFALILPCLAFAFQSTRAGSPSSCRHTRRSTVSPRAWQRPARQYPEFYEDEDDFEDEADVYYDRDYSNPSSFRRRRRPVDDLGEFQESTGLNLPSGFGRRSGWRLPEAVSKSLLAGVFVLGVGLGVTIDSQGMSG
jgi:hypothetical protein